MSLANLDSAWAVGSVLKLMKLPGEFIQQQVARDFTVEGYSSARYKGATIALNQIREPLTA